MANFCTNCGTKLRKEDNYCTKCGTKVLNENIYCIICGTKLRKEDNYCTTCGTKIVKSDIKQKNNSFESVLDSAKKEEKKKIKKINEIFESDEIKSEIQKNNINPLHVVSIKDRLKNKLINKKEKMSDEEIKHFIKTELGKVSKKQDPVRIVKKPEIKNQKIEENKRSHGGYCSLSCRHCYEEFLDSGGGIVGDFDSGGYVEYYCALGHPRNIGMFCEDYE